MLDAHVATFATSRSEWPVFIIGSHRSGSTLLRYLLDAHEHLACPPETKFIAGLEKFVEYPQAERALYTLGLGSVELYRKIRDFVNSILCDYAQRQQKRRWVDKTPNYFRLLPFIDRVFADEVLYAVMIRHPLDVIASLEEFFASARHEDPEVAQNVRQYGKGRYAWAKYWCDVYERVYIAAESHPERFHTLRYEDLVRETELTIRAVLEFIGEPYSESLIERAFEREPQRGYQDKKILKTKRVHDQSIDRWHRWPVREAAALWAIVGPLAAKYGYCGPR